MKPPLQPIPFEQFRALVADMLHVRLEQVTPEAYFVTDLGVDSIRMVEVLLRLESMGLPLSPELAWRIQTVDDAYRYYQEQAGA
jgi:acyl carrier protein